eukprot:gene32824-40516_t
MDLVAKTSNGKHIIADATSYDFVKNKFNIKHVLLERLPTAKAEGIHLLSDLSASYRRFDVIGRTVLQVAKAMQTGAILEIEWDPHVSLVECAELDIEISVAVNPFHGFFNNTFGKPAVLILRGATDLPGLVITPEASDLAERIRRELEYCRAHGMKGSVKSMVDRMFMELLVLMHTKQEPEGTPMLLGCQVDSCSTEEYLRGSRDFFIHECLKQYADKSYVTFPDPTSGDLHMGAMSSTIRRVRFARDWHTL